MVYKVPASKASIRQNRFEFSMPGEKKTRSIPKLGFMKPSLMLRIRDLESEVDILREVFEEVAPGENLLERFEDAEQMMAFFQAWQEESGIGVGESEGSSEQS